MAEVNPYVNTEGRTLTIYTRNGDNWSPSSLPSGMGATLSQDGNARNIWDSGDKTVTTSNKLSGTAGWILPSPSDAGDINSVNVIIVNNSNIDHATMNNVLIRAGQTFSARLPLGIIYLNKRSSGVNTVLSATSSADQTNRFQILPLPDQIVTISVTSSTGASVTVSSLVGTRISMTTLSIHNCFNSTLFIRLRPCDGAVSQNFGQIASNQTIRLSVYSDYEIFLESGDGMIVSDFFNIINADGPNRPPIGTLFFQTNGISTISCTGSPMPSPGPTPPPGPSPGPTPPPPVVKTVQTTWNTAVFPVNGSGACIGDTTAMVSSVINTTAIRVGDSVRFVSSDGQSHNLVQTDIFWTPKGMPDFPLVTASNSFNHSITFTKAGCFYFISSPQGARMRLRISITDNQGNGGCNTACSSIPDRPVVITPAVVVVPADDDLSFLERWWWAILICIIIVVLIIGLIIYLVWYNNKTPTPTTTTVTQQVTRTPVSSFDTRPVTSFSTQPVTSFDTRPVTSFSTRPVTSQPVVLTRQNLPTAVYSTTGSGLTPNPAGFVMP